MSYPFKIDAAASGANTAIAAVAGKRIKVLSYVLSVATATTVQWKSDSTALSGAMTLASGVPLQAPAGPVGTGGFEGHLQTAAGEALVLALGGNVQVSGHGTYTLEN